MWVLEFDENHLYGPFISKEAALSYGQYLASVKRDESHSYHAVNVKPVLYA